MITDNQSDFREHHGTKYVVTISYDKISAAIDNNETNYNARENRRCTYRQSLHLKFLGILKM